MHAPPQMIFPSSSLLAAVSVLSVFAAAAPTPAGLGDLLGGLVSLCVLSRSSTRGLNPFVAMRSQGGGAAGNAAAAKKPARRDANGRLIKKENLGPLKRRYGDIIVSWERFVEKK